MRRIIDAARWCLLRYMFAISARHVKAGRTAEAAEVDGWIDRMNVHDAEDIDGNEVEVYVDGEPLYSDE